MAAINALPPLYSAFASRPPPATNCGNKIAPSAQYAQASNASAISQQKTKLNLPSVDDTPNMQNGIAGVKQGAAAI